MSTLTIEMLFPEVANLHGDNANITYLAQCRPDARVIRTGLNERPAFLDEHVDLLYLGPLTERAQLKAIDRLSPHRAALEARIASDAVTLFTHNALEVLGARVRNPEMGYELRGLELLPLEADLRMFGRYNGKVMGVLPEVGPEHPVLGWKSQFSRVTTTAELPGFLTADRGVGRDESTPVEGVRVGGLLGTSLLGPLLVANPHLTRWLLRELDPDAEPVLAHEELALAAYDARLRDFRDPRRWHRFEKVRR